MKKYVLFTLMCLASYTGAFASNEVIKNDFVSTEVEKSNEIETFNILNIKNEDPNCFVSIKIYNGAEISVVSISSRTDGEAPCNELADGFRDIFEQSGYEILEFDHSYYY